ncbi:MAG: hypothetical protein HC903_17165 [Methylacidiphilales bacterium]|nr:hypothetical protein [Candidatus Methylacidiphilales bacterium]
MVYATIQGVYRISLNSYLMRFFAGDATGWGSALVQGIRFTAIAIFK